MAKPVLVVVDAEDTSLQALTRELESRYGAHYQVVSAWSAEVALNRLAELKAAGADVPLVLADQQMPGTSGAELLARVRDIFPTARRGLLISWGDQSAPAPFLEAAALGWLEFYLPKPSWSPNEQFHRVITGSLEEWWREQGGRFESITVIGDDPSARVHEIRDLLARNSIPFGFYRSDSPEGRAALRRLGVSEPAGPVLSLYTGVVLVDPANAEVAKALGLDVRPAGRVYDVVIVGARPGRAHGSGTTWDSLMVSAVGSWRSAPTNRRGCSALTSCTATRRRRWPKTRTCWWSDWRMAARPTPVPW
jgi:thioredoxin reductase (NADPH)